MRSPQDAVLPLENVVGILYAGCVLTLVGSNRCLCLGGLSRMAVRDRVAALSAGERGVGAGAGGGDGAGGGHLCGEQPAVRRGPRALRAGHEGPPKVCGVRQERRAVEPSRAPRPRPLRARGRGARQAARQGGPYTNK
eukprot:1193568-Prorocentrum_minimum.AAC.2